MGVTWSQRNSCNCHQRGSLIARFVYAFRSRAVCYFSLSNDQMGNEALLARNYYVVLLAVSLENDTYVFPRFVVK